jgi:hypothetical protein
MFCVVLPTLKTHTHADMHAHPHTHYYLQQKIILFELAKLGHGMNTEPVFSVPGVEWNKDLKLFPIYE